jgi:hypothetical protein
MLFSDVLSRTRRLVEDQGIRWDDTAISQYLVDGVNEVRRKTGSVTERTFLSLVQSQTEYDLPFDGRLISVKIIPENSIEAKELCQVPIESLPVASNDEEDPERYGLVTNGGPDGNQMTIVMFPPPGRTTANAIVIEQSNEWSFVADSNATQPQLDTAIPVLPKFDTPLIYYVAGSLLQEMNDTTYIQKGQYFMDKAEKDIGNYAYVNSLSHWDNPQGRNFP